MSDMTLINAEYELAQKVVWNKVHRLRLIKLLKEKKTTKLSRLWDS